MAIFGSKTEEQTNAAPALATGPKSVPMVLLGSRLSEKSARLIQTGKYVFNVTKNANKVEIKKAVERAYKVNVVQVNILNTKGKVKNFGRIAGKTAGFKKAVVTLKQGQKIEGATETI